MTAQNFQFKTNSLIGAVQASGGKAQAKTRPVAESSIKNMDQLALDAIIEGNFSKARKILDDGLSLHPTCVNLHRLSGDVFLQQNDPNSALRAYMEAMSLDPVSTVTLNSIGSLLIMMKKNNTAKGFFQAAHQTKPTDVFAAYNLMHASMHESDWAFFDRLPDMLRLGDEQPPDVQPFTLLAISDDPGLHRRRVEARCKHMLKAVKENKRFERSPVEGRKIRIGFFSSDFYEHATMLLMGRFFDLLDKTRFELCIYDYIPKRHDPYQQQVERAADLYRDVQGLSDHELTQLARQDGIDIAIDMKGYTRNGRMAVFAERAAPIQVSYLGYPGTSGLASIDYFLADEVTVPKDMRSHFTEKLMNMPHCYQVNDNQRKRPENLPSRAELGLPEDKFIFCSLNNPNKVTPAEFDVWMKLLRNVENSVLWILAPQDILQQNLLKEAEARGVEADRLIFADRISMDGHLARMGQADLFLDAFNCNAHTTASEAVWNGVPLVTKAGNQFAARVAASVVTAIGCPDLVTETVEDYYDLAYKLATDAAALAEIKQRLKDNLTTTPLYDSEAYVRDFENLMEMAIQRYDAGLKPKHLSLK